MRGRSAAAWAAGLVALGLAGAAKTQPGLARIVHSAKESDEVYAFPPPAQLHIATLGWDAAAADLLWADLLVQYGTHWSEHRDFTAGPNFIDAILELDPTYPDLYKFVDTLLAYRPLQGTEADVRKAREYLERGTRQTPYDPKIWLAYGQFIAFIAPSFLHDDAEKNIWRRDGAIAMGHAADLGADPDYGVTAASMLTRAGQTEIAIRYLEHQYAFTEHPSMTEIHEAIGRRLASLKAGRILEQADAHARAVEARRRREMPFATPDQYLLLGPVTDPVECAGTIASHRTACKRDWSDLGASEPETSAD